MCLGTGTPFGVNDGFENMPKGAEGVIGGSHCPRHRHVFMLGAVIGTLCPYCRHEAAEARRLAYHPPGKHRHGCYSNCPEMTDEQILALRGLVKHEMK